MSSPAPPAWSWNGVLIGKEETMDPVTTMGRVITESRRLVDGITPDQRLLAFAGRKV